MKFIYGRKFSRIRMYVKTVKTNPNINPIKNVKIMKYKLVQRKNPQKPAEPGKWYPQAVNAGKVTVKQIVTDIAGRSSLTRGDINNVLDNFLDRLPAYLMLGHSVQLGSFGTIRLSVTGEGVDTNGRAGGRVSLFDNYSEWDGAESSFVGVDKRYYAGNDTFIMRDLSREQVVMWLSGDDLEK